MRSVLQAAVTVPVIRRRFVLLVVNGLRSAVLYEQRTLSTVGCSRVQWRERRPCIRHLYITNSAQIFLQVN